VEEISMAGGKLAAPEGTKPGCKRLPIPSMLPPSGDAEGTKPGCNMLPTPSKLLAGVVGDKPGWRMLLTPSKLAPDSDTSVGITLNSSTLDGLTPTVTLSDGTLNTGVGSLGRRTVVCPPLMMLVATILLSPTMDAIVCTAGI
jgi:hypothetical protein